ncbi:hypothetical protein LX32DRAFT_84987 [Colletotrichum zoysiae]|uniref:Uncharacterized protein n=1 Tax=Colletotrichum zoysiae TaxID=1216348 RepID=A0AAD9M0L9_9PEZI|nr:hypothetical protein LX32DRAFT_84987 [Colletotrichum zoysiae]
MNRTDRAAACPGLTKEQRASYLTQFHVIELEQFIDDQAAAKTSTQNHINFLESMVIRLQHLANKSKVSNADIQALVKAHRTRVSMGKKDLETASANQRRATAQITVHTNNNSNIHANISARAAFRSVIDDLDGVVHALQESQAPPTLHARDNARLRSVLTAKDAEIRLLKREIAELKVGSYGSCRLFMTLS